MAIRFLLLIVVGVISGCVLSPPYLQKRDECSPIPQSTTARCYDRMPMTQAEYETARNKLRHSLEEEAAGEDDELREIIPLGDAYKLGTVDAVRSR